MPSKYLDWESEKPRVSFHTPQEITPRLEDTPEGFLICRDVALARTGTQIYLAHEVPVEPGPDGTVVVERPEEEVFRPETIESFRGKPFTDNHPYEDVSTENYKNHLIGTVMNPRRGEGDRSHCLIGDIIVYDAKVIRQIKAGKREVSCGYDADYQKVEPGYGRQVNILGNHVSLVAEGRCGSTCAITDEKAKIMATGNKTSFIDGLRAAFKAKDEDAFEEAINEAKKEGVDESEDPERPDTNTKGPDNQHHVTVNIGGMSSDSRDAMRKDGKGARDEDSTEENTSEPSMEEKMTAALTAIASRLDAIESRLDDVSDDVDDVKDPTDMATQDAVARAEILKPGIKLPTFDSKPGSKEARAAIAGFQRTVLADAFQTTDGRAVIQPLVGSKSPNFSKMSDEAVGIVFRGASERMRDANNEKRGTQLPFHVQDGERKTFDNAAWNKRNRDFWNK